MRPCWGGGGVTYVLRLNFKTSNVAIRESSGVARWKFITLPTFFTIDPCHWLLNMTSHLQQCKINNEHKKFRLYSWHLVYYKKNNVVQKFKLSVNSVSCKATCRYRGNLKEEKKEIRLVDVICWRSMRFGWITGLLDAVHRSILPNTASTRLSFSESCSLSSS